MKDINYEDIDKEVRNLCYVLNKVPGIKTIESCFGHGKSDIYIWAYTTNLTLMHKFIWGSCHFRFLNDKWTIQLSHGDPCKYSKRLRFTIVGKNGLTEEDCNKLATRILEWLNKEEDLKLFWPIRKIKEAYMSSKLHEIVHWKKFALKCFMKELVNPKLKIANEMEKMLNCPNGIHIFEEAKRIHQHWKINLNKDITKPGQGGMGCCLHCNENCDFSERYKEKHYSSTIHSVSV